MTITPLLAGIVLSMSGPAQTAPDRFVDVPTDHWAYQTVESLRQKNIVIGYPDGNYRGKRTLTRYELATALDKVLKVASLSPRETPLGQMGPPGPQGPQGPRGPQGPPGPKGEAPKEVELYLQALKEMREEILRLHQQLGDADKKIDQTEKEVQKTRVSPVKR